jgi:MFS family permease
VAYTPRVSRSSGEVTGPVAGRLDRMGWTALDYGPFRLFLGAMFASTSGSFLYYAALGWYVLELTGSAAAVGFAFTATGLPILFLTPHVGVLTDRLGARFMLLVSLGGMAAVAIAQAAAALGGVPSYGLVVALALALGIGQTIGAPASVAIVNELVPPPAVSSANALNFLHMNVSRIFGGLIGGFLLATTTAAATFTVAAAMFVVPVIIMSRVRTARARLNAGRPRAAFVGPLAEAFRYAVGHPTLGVLIFLSIAPGAIGMSYIFMLPVAADELGIGAGGLGVLMAASGIGGLLAGLSLESIERRFGHGRAVFGGIFGAAIGLTAFGLAPGVPLAIGALVIVGASFLMFGAASVTLTQVLAPPRMRARMVSLFATFYWGMMPVGALLVGLVAEATSARAAITLCGVGLAAAGAAALIARPQIATLALGRDGLTLSGDLSGSGVEPSALARNTPAGAPVLAGAPAPIGASAPASAPTPTSIHAPSDSPGR